MKRICLCFVFVLFCSSFLFCTLTGAQPLDTEKRLRAFGVPGQPRDGKMLALLGIARARHKKAQIYEKQGRFESAIEEMKKILALDIPKNTKAYGIKVFAYNYIADLYLKSGRGSKALEIVEKALQEAPEKSPFTPKLYMIKGEVFERLGKDDEALKAFDKAISDGERLLEKGGEKQNQNKK